jgi:hypothetical protein
MGSIECSLTEEDSRALAHALPCVPLSELTYVILVVLRGASLTCVDQDHWERVFARSIQGAGDHAERGADG